VIEFINRMDAEVAKAELELPSTDKEPLLQELDADRRDLVAIEESIDERDISNMDCFTGSRMAARKELVVLWFGANVARKKSKQLLGSEEVVEESRGPSVFYKFRSKVKRQRSRKIRCLCPVCVLSE